MPIHYASSEAEMIWVLICVNDIFVCRDECSVYETHTDICDGFLSAGIDSVYAKSSIGTQQTIAELLNEKEKLLEAVIFTHDEECVKQVYRVFCHYYLPPCGNITHPAPPSSICQEECQMVQNKCQRTWDLAVHFIDIEPLINCSDTSKLLLPLPHCCTTFGIGQPPYPVALRLHLFLTICYVTLYHILFHGMSKAAGCTQSITNDYHGKTEAIGYARKL